MVAQLPEDKECNPLRYVLDMNMGQWYAHLNLFLLVHGSEQARGTGLSIFPRIQKGLCVIGNVTTGVEHVFNCNW